MAKVELNVVELLKYMNDEVGKKAKSERSSATRRDKKQEIDWSKVDLVEALSHIQQEETRIKTAKEMLEKLLKKEEKKDDKKDKPKLTLEQATLLLVMSFFILGPITSLWLRKMGL